MGSTGPSLGARAGMLPAQVMWMYSTSQDTLVPGQRGFLGVGGVTSLAFKKSLMQGARICRLVATGQTCKYVFGVTRCPAFV